jgi:hypothetical protein
MNSIRYFDKIIKLEEELDEAKKEIKWLLRINKQYYGLLKKIDAISEKKDQ